MLQLRPGMRVLDLACGQGAFTRELERLGVNALGVDASSDLIRAARQRGGRATFKVLRAEQLHTLEGQGTFDAVVCILAIQNIELLAPVMNGCAGLLRPGGKAIFVMTHPSFRIPRQSGWGEDTERKLLYRRVDHYLSPLKVPIQVHPGSAPNLVAWSFHRPLQDYVRALADAGLFIDAVEEWASNKASQPGPRARAENRARAEIPLFLALRAVRIPAVPTRAGG